MFAEYIRQATLASELTEYERFGLFKSMNSCFPCHSRKIIEELIKRLSAFEVLQESLKWHARAFKDRRSPENIGVSGDHAIGQSHSLKFYPAREGKTTDPASLSVWHPDVLHLSRVFEDPAPFGLF